jgi:hypothetical protein
MKTTPKKWGTRYEKEKSITPQREEIPQKQLRSSTTKQREKESGKVHIRQENEHVSPTSPLSPRHSEDNLVTTTMQQPNKKLEVKHAKLQGKYQKLQKKNQKVLPNFFEKLCFSLF